MHMGYHTIHTHTPLYCPNFGASGEIRTVSPQHDDVGMDWAGGRISSIKLADAHALAISFQLVFVQCNRLVMTMQLWYHWHNRLQAHRICHSCVSPTVTTIYSTKSIQFSSSTFIEFWYFHKVDKEFFTERERERERNEELDEFDWVFNFKRIAIHLVFQNVSHCVLWRAWRELNIAIQELSNILSIFLHLSSMSLHSHMTLLQSIPYSFRSSATS